MSNVEFEENNFLPQMRRERVAKGLIGLVISTGVAENEKQANIILVCVGFVCLISSIGVIYFANKEDTSKMVSKQKVEEIMRLGK